YASTRGWCSRSSSKAERGAVRGRPSSVLALLGVPVAVAVVIIAITVPVVLVPAAMTPVAPARMLVLVPLAHPLVADEVEGLAAGSVLPAVAAPVLLVRGRHVQVDRPTLDDDGRCRDDHRLRGIKRVVRQLADVDAAVHARLVDADRDTGRNGGLRCRRAEGAGGEDERENGLHGSLLVRGSEVNVPRCRSAD